MCLTVLNFGKKLLLGHDCLSLAKIICLAGVPCGYTVTDRRGEITSPNYPKTYAENLDCEWKIYVGKTETITIQFLDFYIDYTFYSTMKCLDYLLVSMFILVASKSNQR